MCQARVALLPLQELAQSTNRIYNSAYHSCTPPRWYLSSFSHPFSLVACRRNSEEFLGIWFFDFIKRELSFNRKWTKNFINRQYNNYMMHKIASEIKYTSNNSAQFYQFFSFASVDKSMVGPPHIRTFFLSLFFVLHEGIRHKKLHNNLWLSMPFTHHTTTQSFHHRLIRCVMWCM